MSSPRRGASKKAPAKAPRQRRSPEEARALILAASQRLIVEHGPDAVGLKDVAREAGVSHALVTHYFGTIDALLHAALEDFAERQRKRMLESIAERPDRGPREWMDEFFATNAKEETARVLAFSFLKGIITREDFFSRRQRGAKRVVDAVLARLAPEGSSSNISREDVEFIVLLLLAATHGYALGKRGYWPSLGVDEPTKKEDAFFFDRLADLVASFALSRAR